MYYQEMSLKEYAKAARGRLKCGYWKEIVEKRNKDIETAVQNGYHSDYVMRQYKNKIAKAGNVENEAEAFYQKVRQLLENGEENPLLKLIDKEKTASMSMEEKQNYVLRLSHALNECKKRYFSECAKKAIY